MTERPRADDARDRERGCAVARGQGRADVGSVTLNLGICGFDSPERGCTMGRAGEEAEELTTHSVLIQFASRCLQFASPLLTVCEQLLTVCSPLLTVCRCCPYVALWEG